MDAETLARCQEPFFSRRRAGVYVSAFGLATVASILERSGGTLEMTSEIGHGTSSTVLFPQCRRGGASLDSGAEPEQARSACCWSTTMTRSDISRRVC